jgi:ABC-type Zn uptake system ZnuABC Zn-binding protein ZnuA
MNRFEQVQNLLESVKDDFSKFYDDGNQAAGTRVRKAMQELKNLAQEIRSEVQEIKNSKS